MYTIHLERWPWLSREKILCAFALLTLAIWGFYFWNFARALDAARFNPATAAGHFIQAVILLIFVQAAAAAVIAILSGRSAGIPADDRERSFALAAYRPAYFVMSAGLVVLTGAGPAILHLAAEKLPMVPVLLANAALAVLVLTHSAAQLVAFRRGG